MSTPTIILGAGVIGGGEQAKINTIASAEEFVNAFIKAGGTSLDTARGYAPGAPGTSETLLGQINIGSKKIEIDTKVVSMIPGSHKKEVIESSIKDSLAALGVKKVRVMYLHAPDRETPFEETAGAMNEAHKAGSFEQFGLSNYTADEVEQIVQICKKNGWVAPTVYQGQYNPIQRNCEAQLFPTLRKHNIAFYAWSPAAGGFFSGKYSKGAETPLDSRAGRGGMIGTMFGAWYFKDEFFDALDHLKAIAAPTPLFEVALRWTTFNSELSAKEGDAVIIGASSIQQLESNMNALKNGPLDANVAKEVDAIWEKVKDVAGPYHF